jgi:shikimate dehydrogenase
VSPDLSAQTRLIALLGDPVAHSLSPRFQNAAFRAADLDGVYVVLRCDAATLPGLLRGIAAAGGAGNVTVPHKHHAAKAVDRRTPAVDRTGACNTFWESDGEVWGDNTDVPGVSRAIHELLGGPAADARVLLLGAGGAARAALCALTDQGAGRVLILNRTPSRADSLRQQFAGERTTLAVVREPRSLRGEQFDLVVNATSLGMRDDDPLPLATTGELSIRAALDLVYRPEQTAWVRHLQRLGVAATDGLGMLLYQGAAAFERWWGCPAPLEAMRAALPPRPGRERTGMASLSP